VNTEQRNAVRRAQHLVRWYPKSWRRRYGDEFEELLIAEILERPHSLRRTGNVVLSGVLARLAPTGLTGRSLDPLEQVRGGLATTACATTAFLAFGAAIWAQLAIGWQWSRPADRATSAGMVTMSGALLLLGVLAVLAIVPVLAVAVHQMRRRGSQLLWPTLLTVSTAVLLFVGGRHFANGWPGTGGHSWSHQGLVPGGVAAFTWASTLSVTSYWAHPNALLLFPTAEVCWMLASPLLLVGLVVGVVKVVRRVEPSSRLLRYETTLAHLSGLGMLVFLGGAAAWIVDGGSGPRNLFHAGAIDVVGIGVMVASLVMIRTAVNRAHRGSASLTAAT
jgi:hypothetical protein